MDGWLRTWVIYPSADGQPSKYYHGPALINVVDRARPGNETKLPPLVSYVIGLLSRLFGNIVTAQHYSGQGAVRWLAAVGKQQLQRLTDREIARLPFSAPSIHPTSSSSSHRLAPVKVITRPAAR